MDAQFKVDKATTTLLDSHPFFGNLVLTFDVKASETVTKTMATDGESLWYNPKYVEQQEQKVLRTDVAHEACHKMYCDHLRRGHREHKLWNIATDYRINLMLKDAGFDLDETYLIDERFRGMDAEEIYEHLKNNPDDKANKQAEAKGGCGCGGLHDHKSSGHADFGEAQVMQDIAQAMAFAKGAGKMPAGLEQYVENILDPKISWEQIVQQFMEQCCTDDFSFQQRDRRTLEWDCFIPGMQSDGVDEFVVAFDTSGSTFPYREQFGSEISAVAAALNKFRALHVIFCDTEVAHVDVYETHDLPIKIVKTHGGGGTDFRPVFDYIEREAIQPKGMVFLTDTEGPFPETPPIYPVLWVVPEDRNGYVPFGQMIEIS